MALTEEKDHQKVKDEDKIEIDLDKIICKEIPQDMHEKSKTKNSKVISLKVFIEELIRKTKENETLSQTLKIVSSMMVLAILF
jgi:hypothetical protein